MGLHQEPDINPWDEDEDMRVSFDELRAMFAILRRLDITAVPELPHRVVLEHDLDTEPLTDQCADALGVKISYWCASCDEPIFPGETYYEEEGVGGEIRCSACEARTVIRRFNDPGEYDRGSHSYTPPRAYEPPPPPPPVPVSQLFELADGNEEEGTIEPPS